MILKHQLCDKSAWNIISSAERGACYTNGNHFDCIQAVQNYNHQAITNMNFIGLMTKLPFMHIFVILTFMLRREAGRRLNTAARDSMAYLMWFILSEPSSHLFIEHPSKLPSITVLPGKRKGWDQIVYATWIHF